MRKTPCIQAPAQARPAPTSRLERTRGRRSSYSMTRWEGGRGAVVIRGKKGTLSATRATTLHSGIGTVPTDRLTATVATPTMPMTTHSSTLRLFVSTTAPHATFALSSLLSRSLSPAPTTPNPQETATPHMSARILLPLRTWPSLLHTCRPPR